MLHAAIDIESVVTGALAVRVALATSLPPFALGADAARAANDSVAPDAVRTGLRLRATTLLDADVRNPQEKSLGKVQDLLLDLSRWEVRYVIVESGGTFGSRGKPGLLLDMDAQKLKSAPGFSRDTQIGWGEYENTLDQYFGIDQPGPTSASRNLQLAFQIIRASNMVDRNGAKGRHRGGFRRESRQRQDRIPAHAARSWH